jgi:two-component system chemotaxis response regulator CheB
VRRLLVDGFSADAALRVIGIAANGRVTLAKIPELRPDVVVLGLEMPVMDGLEALEEIRLRHPEIPVVVFASLTESAGERVIKALWLGAGDLVIRTEASNPDAAITQVRAELVPRIKALCSRRSEEDAPAHGRGPRLIRRTQGVEERVPAQVVVLIATHGGPTALTAVLRRLGPRPAVPILIVQRIPAALGSLFAAELAERAHCAVAEAQAGADVGAGTAWVIAEGEPITVHAESSGPIQFARGRARQRWRPPIDLLLESVAGTWGAGALVVVLTGGSPAGLRGCRSITAAGGRVLAQDQPSSTVWGLAGAAFRAGVAEQVLPLEALGDEVLRRMEPTPRPDARAA